MLACPKCHKSTEILEEIRARNTLLRKFQCGHWDSRKDYFSGIEEIRGDTKKKLPFRRIEDRIRELEKIIAKIEESGELTVDSAKRLREELLRLRDAEIPQRKVIARALRILQEDWQIVSDDDRRSVNLIREQFQKSGYLSAEHFGKLEHLEKKYVNKRKGVSPDIIAMRKRR